MLLVAVVLDVTFVWSLGREVSMHNCKGPSGLRSVCANVFASFSYIQIHVYFKDRNGRWIVTSQFQARGSLVLTE